VSYTLRVRYVGKTTHRTACYCKFKEGRKKSIVIAYTTTHLQINRVKNHITSFGAIEHSGKYKLINL
jgi:hypothetical protein